MAKGKKRRDQNCSKMPVPNGEDFCGAWSMKKNQADHKESDLKSYCFCWVTAVVIWKAELTLPMLWMFWIVMRSEKPVTQMGILHIKSMQR